MSLRVRLSGQLICADVHELQVVLAYLPAHVRLTRAETGCIFFDVRQTEDPLVWQVEEEFQHEAAFALHQQRAANSAWAEASEPALIAGGDVDVVRMQRLRRVGSVSWRVGLR